MVHTNVYPQLKKMHNRVFNYLSNTQDAAIISEKKQNAIFLNEIKPPIQPMAYLKQVKKIEI